ncbi:hypothetical protein BDR26DRAFT_869069 [Obelidium mucronatum]|nr:hypothetical protein BDR26DRAFT_869069 [Obelidium mucronatum]
MSLCVPLTGSAMCSDFAGLSALVPAQAVSAGVTTAAALDAYIASSSDPTPSGGFGGAMRSSVFGCTGWDGTGFRYYASVLCATMIAQGIANVDTPTPCNPAGTVVPLCDATIGKYIFAYQRVYQNTLFCPAGANPTAQALVNNVIGMRAAAVFSTDATCVVAEGVEKSNCGFNTAAEATNFCATDSSNDAVLRTTTAAAPLATQPVATSPPTQSSPSTSGGMSTTTMIYIGAGAGGGLLLIIAIVVFCCCIKKKKSAQSIDEFDRETRDMKMTLQGNPAPMGYSNMPPPPAQSHKSGPKDTYVSAFNYQPQQGDELATFAGDKIIVKHEYDDGWAYGINTRTRITNNHPRNTTTELRVCMDSQSRPTTKDTIKDTVKDMVNHQFQCHLVNLLNSSSSSSSSNSKRRMEMFEK